MLTNTAPTGAYRGAGRPEAIYIDRAADRRRGARDRSIDPAELRRRNMIRPEQMPYTNPMAQTYDSGDFEQILDQGLALADWNGFDARRARVEGARQAARPRHRDLPRMDRRQRVRGDASRVDVTADGFIEIFSATQAMGQGIATSYAQLAVDVFGVPIDRIRIVQGDTDRGNGFGSAGSRSLFTGGSAVQVASERTVEHGEGRSPAEALEAAAGRHRVPRRRASRSPAPTVGIGLFELAGKQPERAHPCSTSTSAVGGADLAERLPRLRGRDRSRHRRRRGRRATASVNDVGRVVNPMIVARPARRRRGAGHRPGAVRAASSTTRRAASC